MHVATWLLATYYLCKLKYLLLKSYVTLEYKNLAFCNYNNALIVYFEVIKLTLLRQNCMEYNKMYIHTYVIELNNTAFKVSRLIHIICP